MRLRHIKTFCLLLLLADGLFCLAQDAPPVKSFIVQNPDGVVFDAHFTFRSNEFSGLFVANPIAEGIRIDMLSKTGMTLMSCTLTADSVVWDKFIPGLKANKKYKRAAEKSFRIATLSGLIKPKKVRVKNNGDFICKGKMKVSYRLNEDGTVVESAKEKGWFKLFRRKADFHYKAKDKTPTAIGLSHSLLNFDIDLKRLD